jgi:hypothetical protein
LSAVGLWSSGFGNLILAKEKSMWGSKGDAEYPATISYITQDRFVQISQNSSFLQ